MTGFKAWRLGEREQTHIPIETSPAGPITLFSFNSRPMQLESRGSAVVLPTEPTNVAWPGMAVVLAPGGYAVVPGGARIFGGVGLIIYTPEYVGLSQVGGPVEDAGRLKYIDGCSDSLLVSPPLKGEPCLNLLHLPPGIHQTEHTHPSERVGIILRGHGVCRTPDGDHPLAAGMFWHIPPETRHSFHTGNDSLDVFAWHPDSDFGPSHDFHPMLNRTIVEGVSAGDARNEAIRTTAIKV